MATCLLNTSDRRCTVESCDRDLYALGMCNPHYQRFGRAERKAGRLPGDNCSRCTRVLGALAADGGRGDRPLLAGSMTLAEASAYLLGFFDRRASEDTDAVDPYIVQRFIELRTGSA